MKTFEDHFGQPSSVKMLSDHFPLMLYGDLPELPLGSEDPSILDWAARNDRIVVTQDSHTMPIHLEARLADGRHSPGVILVRMHQRISDIVESLQLIAHAGVATEYKDAVSFMP